MLPKTRKRLRRSTLIKKLDTIFSKYIRARDRRCVICGSVESLHCGHFLSRRNQATRWNEQNCNTQCCACNYEHNNNPLKYLRFMQQKYGDQTIKELEKKYYSQQKISNITILAKIEYYKHKLKELEK